MMAKVSLSSYDGNTVFLTRGIFHHTTERYGNNLGRIQAFQWEMAKPWGVTALSSAPSPSKKVAQPPAAETEAVRPGHRDRPRPAGVLYLTSSSSTGSVTGKKGIQNLTLTSDKDQSHLFSSSPRAVGLVFSLLLLSLSSPLMEPHFLQHNPAE